MAYLDYVGLAYFKSLLDENYLRTDYDGDTTIQGNVTFTEPVDADVKNDYLGNQIDKTYIKDIVLDPEGSGALALVLGDGSVSHLLTNTTVSQVRSSANELYPVLLCYDANAEEAQITKTVKYVHDVQINPSTGYISAKGMYVKHPTFNRRNGVSQKVEWAYDFTDAVSGLGNPMSQVYAYVDPASEGGEHCIELRLYGNPNVSPTVPSINDSTNTFSIGVGVTGGNVQFGYCPSTPLYLDNGSTLRTEATGHGNDIITRDWLNLNGSLTGLVHTTMNETIDGAKTFKKTVTINSGDNSNKADLYVQGNSDVHGNEHVYGTETVDGKLTANGTAEIKGGSGNTPSLTVTGNETVTGNSSIGGNSSVAGNETVSGKIIGNNGAEINGGNGLIVNGNETVNGEIYKLINNIPQEYVSYVTNKQETKTTIVNNLIKDKGGLAVDSSKNIYVNTGRGLAVDSAGKINVDFTQMPTSDITNVVTGMVAPGSGLVADSSTGKLAVDFNQMPTDKFEALLSSLKMLIPLSADMDLHVNNQHANKGNSLVEGRGAENKPFETIQACVNYITSIYALGGHKVRIYIHPGTYNEALYLGSYSTSGGYIQLIGTDVSNKPIIYPSAPGCHTNVSCYNNAWDLIKLKLIQHPSDNNASPTASRIFPYLVASRSNAQVNIYACDFEFTCTANNSNRLYMFMFSAEGGSITFRPSSYSPITLVYEKGSATGLNVLSADRGSVNFGGTYATEDYCDIPCQGSCSTFADSHNNSLIAPIGSGDRFIKFVVAPGQSCTGSTHSVSSGSGIRSNQGDPYPGDTEGYVEAATYSWYKV